MFIKINHIITNALKKTGASSLVIIIKAQKELNKIIEEKYGNKYICQFKVLSLNNQILTIQCANNVLANELFLNKNNFLSKLNKKTKSNQVNSIRIVY